MHRVPPEEGVRGSLSTGATQRPRFLADAMVADLARWLRILGEDCLWAPPSWPDSRVLEVAGEHGRIVLTRDDRLVERGPGHGVGCLRVPQAVVEEVLFTVYDGMGLVPRDDLLASRCSLCNGPLVQTNGEQARAWARSAGREPPMDEVLERHERFWSCQVCGQPFWRGTHWREIERVRDRLIQRLESGS